MHNNNETGDRSPAEKSPQKQSGSAARITIANGVDYGDVLRLFNASAMQSAINAILLRGSF